MYPVYTIEAEDFPPLLQEINDPPKRLFARGNMPDQKLRWLAVVGSRATTAYGKEVCASLIKGLAGYPVVIVSGLAIGIDTLAHKTALEVGLKTVAIPGSGVNDDVLYPVQNRTFAKRILEEGGTIMSEFSPDAKSHIHFFPQRNRIMAGISHATLVIEANEKSGTLITARLAMDYNRDVLAVPGSIFSHNSYGPHLLIRSGATPIRNSDDILDVFNLEKKNHSAFNISNLSDSEQKVISLLASPLQRDELIRALPFPVSEAQSLLMAMEIKGLINESLGEMRSCV